MGIQANLKESCFFGGCDAFFAVLGVICSKNDKNKKLSYYF